MIASILTWLHVVCMLGALGALAATQFGLNGHLRRTPGATIGPDRLAAYLLLVGLLCGLLLYAHLIRMASHIGGALSGHVHGVVGFKFVLLLIAGGLLGAAMARAKRGRHEAGGLLRALALVALLLASFTAFSL